MSGTVAVTGAASGLGAAVVELMLDRAAAVIGVDLSGSDIDADLATATGREDAIRSISDRTGDALDGLVVCAGLGPQHPDHARIVSVNYFGAIELLEGLRPALERGTAPAAVAISSNSTTIDPTVDADLVAACLAGDEPGACRRAQGLAGNSVYASTKVAVARAVRHRVAAWGQVGVRINAVAPGPFDSPLLAEGLADDALRPLIEALPIPLGRRGTPREVAETVAFLLSDAARWVHGSILFVDGGIDALFQPERI